MKKIYPIIMGFLMVFMYYIVICIYSKMNRIIPNNLPAMLYSGLYIITLFSFLRAKDKEEVKTKKTTKLFIHICIILFTLVYGYMIIKQFILYKCF